MFGANFVELEKGILLRVDAAKKIVRTTTVLEFIDAFYKKHDSAGKEEKRGRLMEELVGKTFVTNYGKMQYHKVTNIKFEEARKVTFTMGERLVTLVEYFEQKYGVTIKKPGQPVLVAEGRRSKEERIDLLPELMLILASPKSSTKTAKRSASRPSSLPRKRPRKLAS